MLCFFIPPFGVSEGCKKEARRATAGSPTETAAAAAAAAAAVVGIGEILYHHTDRSDEENGPMAKKKNQ